MGESAGVTVNIPDDSVFPSDMEIPLSTGTVAKMRKAKGRDMKAASRFFSSTKMGNTAEDGISFMHAMIAFTTQINGKVVKLEDIEDMDLVDVVKLQKAYNDLNFPEAAKSGEGEESSSSDTPPT